MTDDDPTPEELAARLGPRVEAICRRHGVGSEEAKEVLREAADELRLRALPAHDRDTRLMQVVERLCRRRREAARRRVLDALASEPPAPHGEDSPEDPPEPTEDDPGEER